MLGLRIIAQDKQPPGQLRVQSRHRLSLRINDARQAASKAAEMTEQTQVQVEDQRARQAVSRAACWAPLAGEAFRRKSKRILQCPRMLIHTKS